MSYKTIIYKNTDNSFWEGLLSVLGFKNKSAQIKILQKKRVIQSVAEVVADTEKESVDKAIAMFESKGNKSKDLWYMETKQC
tara:strand:- start:313 stop:558 length:246 start_codon:yes stop_codon:yes gene_type:complete